MLMSRDGNKLMSGNDYGLLNESAKYGMDLSRADEGNIAAERYGF